MYSIHIIYTEIKLLLMTKLTVRALALHHSLRQRSNTRNIDLNLNLSFPKAIAEWNKLQEETVFSQSLCAFKSKLIWFNFTK